MSFAVRELKSSCGIVITASHNPKEYNGYKVYWKDGGQIIYPHDQNIINEVNKLDNFSQWYNDIIVNADLAENSGVRGTPFTLLSSYLTNRYQYTYVNDSESQKLLVKYGVPQGSVLGRLLFLLYISDMVNCYRGTGCEFILYADDTNLFVIEKSRGLAR